MDDMDQGGAGGAPLHDDDPQSRRRRPTARGDDKPAAGRDASAEDLAAASGKEGEAADALSPSPRAQRDSTRRK
ncbi:hypothetical protein ACWEPM_19665 [Streptomyces sp. NPDC004244]|uniref:hypothetical protein n=1 Tax=Streptomyces sp. NPDC101206 TaxID=3366128 RepID=UPI0037FF2C56